MSHEPVDIVQDLTRKEVTGWHKFSPCDYEICAIFTRSQQHSWRTRSAIVKEQGTSLSTPRRSVNDRDTQESLDGASSYRFRKNPSANVGIR